MKGTAASMLEYWKKTMGPRNVRCDERVVHRGVTIHCAGEKFDLVAKDKGALFIPHET
jgi:hypothetical protein